MGLSEEGSKWMAAAGVGLGLGLPAGLAVVAAVWFALRRLANIDLWWTELQLAPLIQDLNRTYGGVKLPDRPLLLRFGSRQGLPDDYWEQFNILYAELDRCPVGKPLRFDFWAWNQTVGLPVPPDEKDEKLFDIAVVLSFKCLHDMDLLKVALWKQEDPAYDTVAPAPPTNRLLPRDKVPTKKPTDAPAEPVEAAKETAPPPEKSSPPPPAPEEPPVPPGKEASPAAAPSPATCPESPAADGAAASSGGAEKERRRTEPRSAAGRTGGHDSATLASGVSDSGHRSGRSVPLSKAAEPDLHTGREPLSTTHTSGQP